MGSFQQISIGAICLVAAYLFGNYVNNNPPPLSSEIGTVVSGVSQTANGLTRSSSSIESSVTGNIQSRLPIADLNPIETQPAPIVTMKTPLKSRFNVPSTRNSPRELGFNRADNNRLPPPSQLARPINQPNNQLAETFSGQPFSSSPFSEPVAVSPTIQVPDFSAIAAEFKNTPIELPNMSRLGGMPSHSNSNRDGANQFGYWQDRNPNNKPLKKLVQGLPDNEFQIPNHQPTEDYYTPEPQRNHVIAPNRGFTQADFEPQLNDNIFGLKPKQESLYKELTQPENERLHAGSNVSTEDYQYDVPPPVPPEFRGRTDQSSGFRGNLTFRPELENRSGASNQNRIERLDPAQINYQRQSEERSRNEASSRLPFRLTETAKTELVQLRDRADAMIGLESTNFVDHTIGSEETLQSISSRYFGSPNFYLDIYLANRDKLRNPADTRAGVSIRVPVYESP